MRKNEVYYYLTRKGGLMRVEETIKLQKTKYSSSWFCEQTGEDHHCLTCRDSDCRDIGMKHGWCVWWRLWLTDGWIFLCLYGLIQKLDATLSVFSVSSHSFSFQMNSFVIEWPVSLLFYDFVLIIAGTWTNDNLIWGWKTFLRKNDEKMGHFLRQFFFYGKLGIRESQQFMTRKEWMKL